MAVWRNDHEESPDVAIGIFVILDPKHRREAGRRDLAMDKRSGD